MSINSIENTFKLSTLDEAPISTDKDSGFSALNKAFENISEAVEDFDFNTIDDNSTTVYQIYNFDNDLDTSDLPHYDDPKRYRFQGFTMTDDYIYISAYDKEGKPSLLLVYDNDGNYVGRVALPSGVSRYAHVGGMSYDKEHDILYITDKKGKVLALDNEILSAAIKDCTSELGKGFNIDLDEKKDFEIDDFIIDKQSLDIRKSIEEFMGPDYDGYLPDAASVYYDEENHKIYIPTFSEDSKIFVYDVEFDNKGKPSYKFDTIYGMGKDDVNKINDTNLPYAVQGVGTYTDSNGDKYLLINSSYSGIDSAITKYKINDDGSIEFAGQHIFNNKYGIENMVVDPDTGDIYCNYENNVAGTRQDGGHIEKININDIDGSNTDTNYILLMIKLKFAAKFNGN